MNRSALITTVFRAAVLWGLCALAALWTTGAPAQPLPALKVSENRRFLVTADGKPFFWLGDTAWELFHRLNREQAVEYLEVRARQGYNVIQAVALAELDGLTVPNAYGHLPLLDRDPARPAVTPGNNPTDSRAYDYWDHVDFIVDEANRRGIYVAFLPTWGAWAPSRRNDRLVVFNPQNAETFGRFLGQRYGGKNIIWVLGGDRDITGHEAIWPPMARGIALGALGREDFTDLLVTFHPCGGASSANWFHHEPWLSFNMAQSGHRHIDDPARLPVWERIGRDYARQPVKPCFDGEPLYEDHPIGFGQARDRGYALDAHVRQRAYWGVFSGGFGHTYGHHSVWQMYDHHHKPINGPLLTWREALERPGALQMRHLRALIESRPFLARVPDPELVVNPLASNDRIVATRGADYAFIFTAQGRPFQVRMGRISGEKVVAWWFNPRVGTAHRIGEFENTGIREFAPSNYGGLGADTVLVLDDAAKKFSPPGSQ